MLCVVGDLVCGWRRCGEVVVFCVFAIRTMSDIDFVLHGSAWMNNDIFTKKLQTYSITKLQQIVIANKNAQNISFIQKIQSEKIRAIVHSRCKKQHIIQKI